MDMNPENQHEMVMKQTFESGAQEWYCPTCGRHFILQFPPSYKRIILSEGDDQVIHSGGTGGVIMGPTDTHQDDSGEMNLPGWTESLDDEDIPAGKESYGDTDDPYLAPWSNWIDNQEL